MSLSILHASTPMPCTCSDCGQPSSTLTLVFDPSTRAELALCPSCHLAFTHRQRFHQGCCD